MSGDRDRANIVESSKDPSGFMHHDRVNIPNWRLFCVLGSFDMDARRKRDGG